MEQKQGNYLVDTMAKQRENFSNDAIYVALTLGNGEDLFMSDEFSASLIVGKNNKKSNDKSAIIPTDHIHEGEKNVSSDITSFAFIDKNKTLKGTVAPAYISHLMNDEDVKQRYDALVSQTRIATVVIANYIDTQLYKGEKIDHSKIKEMGETYLTAIKDCHKKLRKQVENAKDRVNLPEFNKGMEFMKDKSVGGEKITGELIGKTSPFLGYMKSLPLGIEKVALGLVSILNPLLAGAMIFKIVSNLVKGSFWSKFSPTADREKAIEGLVTTFNMTEKDLKPEPTKAKPMIANSLAYDSRDAITL